MKAWMLSIADLVRPWVSRRPATKLRVAVNLRDHARSIRKSRAWSSSPATLEGLEGRALLATTVQPFATLAGDVVSTKQASQVTLNIGPGALRDSQAATVIVGFYVEATDGSPINPEITKVTGPNGTIKPLSIAPHGNTASDRLARQSHTFARIIPLTGQAQTITLNVASANGKTGDYIVEAFLAGDVNNDNSVDTTDLNALNAAYGTSEGQANYLSTADVNGDGRIGCIDRQLTRLNIGAQLVSPATSSATASSVVVPLATTQPEVNLAATAATATTAVATPVALATPLATTTTTTPVVLTPVYSTTAIPAAAATSASGYTTSAVPVAYTTTYPTTATPVAYTTTTPIAGSTGTTATPAYYIGQPVAATTTAGTTATTPVYLYGQPVVGGSTAATLFGQPSTTQTATSAAVPVPVYLYGTPTYSAASTSTIPVTY